MAKFSGLPMELKEILFAFVSYKALSVACGYPY